MAFTNWINNTLQERGLKIEGGDLFAALVDGSILYNLVEVLSGDSLAQHGRLKPGKMKIQLVANCSISFNYLATVVKIGDIAPQDVVDMIPKRVLGTTTHR
jgi:hypothetical protein